MFELYEEYINFNGMSKRDQRKYANYIQVTEGNLEEEDFEEMYNQTIEEYEGEL